MNVVLSYKHHTILMYFIDLCVASLNPVFITFAHLNSETQTHQLHYYFTAGDLFPDTPRLHLRTPKDI